MIQKLKDRRLMLTAVLAGMAMLAVVISVVTLASVVDRNCNQIEVLKSQLRPEPFNLQETSEILRDLGTDPESERGKRLLEKGRQTNVERRALLAPHNC